MAKLRRDRGRHGRRLTVIEGGQARAGDGQPQDSRDGDRSCPDGDQANLEGDPPAGPDGGDQSGGELEELRDTLTALGVPAQALLGMEWENPGGIIDDLIESGALPSPEESLASLLETWRPLLRRGCHPFEAELTGVEFVSALRYAAPDPAQVPVILSELLTQTARAGGDEALAMLRVMAVAGPAELRPGAAAAADTLAAGGLRDRPWVRELGRPRLDRCFGYADDLGAQEAIAISFRYGRRTHAIAVLIDHDLGGGVKDCWPTEHPDEIYEGYQAAAEEYDLEMRDYSPAEAQSILERALARTPCPAEPDQIEDVEAYLALLEQRVGLLAGSTGAPPT